MRMLSPHEVAERLNISYDSALAFIKYAGIDYVKIGRQYRVSEDKLNAFLSKKGRIHIDLNEP
ncbi:MAG: excisionase family DNA-binding protein [Clostridia bacterium]|nr:excisionase family DNA-binding protein [Clostridia bacterium]